MDQNGRVDRLFLPPVKGARVAALEPMRSASVCFREMRRIRPMKHVASIAALAVLLSTNLALAQAGPGGRASTTGDPAASSATSGTSSMGNAIKSNPSGSGTSTSGGKDDNGDQGRDKMPESNMESG